MSTSVTAILPKNSAINSTDANAYKPAFYTYSQDSIGEYKQEEFANDIKALQSHVENVSRPTNGIVAKPNTHAFAQVIAGDGKVIKCFNNIGLPMGPEVSGYYLQDAFNIDGGLKKEEPMDANALARAALEQTFGGANIFGEEKQAKALQPDSDPLSPIWTDWILQSVQESRIEKTQVVETFGDSYFYAFGQRPRSINFQGLLMNTTDYNWRSVFWKNWDEFFRATKLVERNARLVLQWDEIIVEGYPINAVCNEVADSPNAMKFSFSLFVTNYVNLAAQSGFLTQRYMRIAQLRAGSGRGVLDKTRGFLLMGGETFMPKSPNHYGGVAGMLNFGPASELGTGIPFEQFSFGNFLGPNAGNHLKELLLGAFKDDPEARDAFLNTNLGRSVTRNLGYAATSLQKYAFRSLRGDNQADLFMTSALRRMGSELIAATAQDVTNLVEDQLGLQRGETNQLLGFIGDLVESAKNETRNGGRTVLSESAKYSTVQRAAVHLTGIDQALQTGGKYTDGDGITRVWGVQAGGLAAADYQGQGISDLKQVVDTDNVNVRYGSPSRGTGDFAE